jgi:flagellar biosynthesis activator protein FlaF
MYQAANAYARTSQATLAPRELEATLLMKAAARLQMIQDHWDERQHELDEALSYNRRLWTILVASATEPDNPLPVPVKQNIANLAVFIFNRTIDTMLEPRAEHLRALVHINRELAAGLRPSAPSAT